MRDFSGDHRALSINTATVRKQGDLVAITEACARADIKAISPWRDQVAFNSATAWGSVAHHLGNLERVLGRLDEAERSLRTAAELHARIGAPLWLARTQVDLSRVLIERGPSRAEASALLGQSLRTARELGCAGTERRAAKLLARLEPSVAPPSGTQ